MNDTYLHLTLTHFPIIGSLIALVLLFSGWFQKNMAITKAALFLLVALALITFVVHHTGEEAEHFTEHLPGFSHDSIEEHAQAGHIAFWLMEVVGLVSLIALYLLNRRSDKARLIVLLVLVTNLVAFSAMAYAGKLAGHIRHTEVYQELPQTTNTEPVTE